MPGKSEEKLEVSFGNARESLRKLPSPSSHQCIALIVMGQERLPESLVDVRVCSVALEVKDAERVE